MSNKLTLIEELQLELYHLIQLHILNLPGVSMQEDENPPEIFISKSNLVEASIKLLNEFGKSLVKDERLKNDNNC